MEWMFVPDYVLFFDFSHIASQSLCNQMVFYDISDVRVPRFLSCASYVQFQASVRVMSHSKRAVNAYSQRSVRQRRWHHSNHPIAGSRTTQKHLSSFVP